MRHLVLGGARSGKSAWAESLVSSLGDARVTYVATARPLPGDEDFSQRIEVHRQRRPTDWLTEDQRELRDVLRQTALLPPAEAPALLVDDLGTWLTGVIDATGAWELPRGTIAREVTELVAAVADYPSDHDLVLVSPEVGMGIIPDHRAGRLFRDEIGALNGAIADVVDEVTLVVAGLPLVLKDGVTVAGHHESGKSSHG